MSTVANHLAKECGYSCQPWLAVSIADRHFGSSYLTWFSTCINPPHNGDSSNPLRLYEELDRIVRTNDYNHGRVDQLKRRLSTWISASRLRPWDVAGLLGEIASAPVPAFRPQLWRIDLRNIHVSRLVSIGQFPDEYLVRDVIPAELQVIV